MTTVDPIMETDGAAPSTQSVSAQPPSPLHGLSGTNPANDVEYVDVTALDPALTRPFLHLFPQGERAAAVHYFATVQEVTSLGSLTDPAPTHAEENAVLIIGADTLRLCAPDSTLRCSIPLDTLSGIFLNNDLIGFKADNDLILRVKGVDRLTHILSKLYAGLTKGALEVTHEADLSVLKIGAASSGTIPPFRSVDVKKPGEVPSAAHPVTIYIVHKGQSVGHMEAGTLLPGRYDVGSDLAEGVPTWCRKVDGGLAIIELCSMDGRWVLSPQPATFSNVVCRSKAPHHGRPPTETTSWEQIGPTGWTPLQLDVSETSSPGTPVAQGSPLAKGGGWCRDGSAWDPADSVVSCGTEPLPEEKECRDLAQDVSRAGLRAEHLRQQLANADARIGRLRRIEGEMRADRDTICRLFDVNLPELQLIEAREGRPPPLAPLVEKACVPALREADRAEAKAVAARGVVNDAKQRLDSAARQKQHMLAQLEAAHTFQVDSKEQLNTVMRCMGDLVERAQRAPQVKDAKQEELQAIVDRNTKERDELVSGHDAAVEALRAKIVAAREARDNRSNERVNERIAAAKTTLLGLQESVSRELQKRKERQLVLSNQSNDAANLAEACNQLSVAHVRLDELEEEASTSCALRYHLEQKLHEVEEKDATVRRAIISLQSLRKAYDQHITVGLQGLEKKQEQVTNLQQSSAAAIQHTNEKLVSLKAQQKRQQQTHLSNMQRLQHDALEVRKQGMANEDKKRWSYEQQLLLARCGSPVSRKREKSAELAIELSKEKQEADERVQDIDKELFGLQAQVIETDEQHNTMKMKRDETHSGLANQEKAVLTSTADEETKMVYPLQHLIQAFIL